VPIRIAWHRALLTFSTLALLAAILYVAWIFGSRWQAQRRLRQAIHDSEVESARKVVEQYASGHVRILAFYASPPMLIRGEHSNLCFGLDSAEWVRIEPGVQPLKPALTRCVSVAPEATTEYTLTAGGPGGAKVSQTVTISVAGHTD
jgi:hypothetical protein